MNNMEVRLSDYSMRSINASELARRVHAYNVEGDSLERAFVKAKRAMLRGRRHVNRQRRLLRQGWA